MEYEYVDTLANETYNDTYYYVHHQTPTEITLKVIQFLACCIGTTADVLMIYIILRYKNMQKPVNIYIMNWLVCDAIFIFVDPSEYQLYTMLEGFYAEREIICVMQKSLVTIQTLDIVFMVVLMFYWFLSKTKVTVFEEHCWKVVIVVWSLAVIHLVAISLPCVIAHLFVHLGDYILICVWLGFIISLITMHCMRHCTNPFSSSSSLPEALVSSFAFSWMTIFILALTIHYIDTLFIIFHLCEVLIYLYPLLIFYLFYKIDPKFAACTKMLFTRNRNVDDVNACFDELMEDVEEGMRTSR